MPLLTQEQERIAKELRVAIGLPRRPVRSRRSIVGPVVTIVAILVAYPVYGAAMLAMEAAVFLDMPFRDTWDRVWVRSVLFVSFCWASLAVTLAIRALVDWAKN